MAFDLPRDTKDSSGDPMVESFDVEEQAAERGVKVEVAEAAGLEQQLSLPELVADLKKSLSDEVDNQEEKEQNQNDRPSRLI